MTTEKQRKPKEQKAPKTQSPKRRVFIIGAGVSASCGIAVASGILRESVLQLAGRNSAKAEKIHKLLRYLYPGFVHSLRNYPNIEDFLNLLEMAKRFNSEEFIGSKLWSDNKLEEVRTLTIEAVTQYTWGFTQKKDNLRGLVDFAGDFLQDGDVIITFNWDLTIERALHGIFQISYSYSGNDEDGVVLLKPHGSIDWFLKSRTPEGKAKKRMVSLDPEACVYPYFNFAENPELLHAEPLIVPPVAMKEFESTIFKRMWRSVYRAVSAATHLFIIGYSLPREDQFARFVLRRAIRNNILRAEQGTKRALLVEVVNPDESVEGTFSRLVGKNVKQYLFSQAYFQDYVEGLQEKQEEEG